MSELDDLAMKGALRLIGACSTRITDLKSQVAALTARNATLERALADVERDVTRPVGIDVTGYYDGAEADLYRKAWHEGADAVRADINKTLRTILAGAK